MAGVKACELSEIEKGKEKGVQKRKTRSVCSVTKSQRAIIPNAVRRQKC
jgi:hypothetical protein